MAKYAICPEGAEALRALAESLVKIEYDIVDDMNLLKNTVYGLSSDLGIYADEILSIVWENKAALKRNMDGINEVVMKIRSMADKMDALLAGKPDALGSSGENKKYNEYWASKCQARTAEFGSLDNRVVEEMCLAIQNAKELFPKLELYFVGSLQVRNQYLQEAWVSGLMSAYMEENPDARRDEVLPAIQRDVKDILANLEPDPRDVAQSFCYQEEPDEVLVRANGITVNEAFGSNYEKIMAILKEDVEKGWRPQNCYSVKSLIDHELGHQIAHLVDAQNDPEIMGWYNEFMQLDDENRAGVLSCYAGKNIQEFIAESWSEYQNNPQCRECARAVGTRLIDLYGTRPEEIKNLGRSL